MKRIARLKKMQQADMVLIEGNIITINKKKPRAQAVAIKDGKIIEVGATNQIRQFIGKYTRIINLQGKTVVPGLTDTHAHMIALKYPLPWLDLRGVLSIKEIQGKLQAKVQTIEKGKWILGRGWDQDRLKEKRYPTRWDLDKVSPNNPVLLKRVCGHVCVANSKSLEIAKINKETATLWGELVDKHPTTGEPTGILREKATDMLWSLPEASEEEMLKACSLACKQAIEAGLTGVHWLVYKPSEIYALQKLRKDSQLPLRIRIMVPVECFDAFADESNYDSFLKPGCVKIYADGSLGARTAALQEPYRDESSAKGVLYYSPNELAAMIKAVDKVGFQVAIHVIGDLAVSETLKAFETAFSGVTIGKRRHRLEHASVLNPHLIRRIKGLGLIVCIQPHFSVSDFWVSNRLGPKRARWTYAFKSLIKSGIVVAASSDAPAEPLSPILGIWAAVARKSFPKERISVEEALEAYTINAAYFSFEESVRGSIEKGKFADLTVLSHDPTKIEPEKIKDIRVEMTIVDGKMVYSVD